MVWLVQFFALLVGLARGLGRWCLNWWRIIHLGAVILVLALSPSSYSRQRWPVLATHVYQATAPVLLWFIALSALFGVVLIRIVVVTATGMGLSQYAVEMVVRVLVLELIPLAAALFVALRCSIGQAEEILNLRRQGVFEQLQAEGKDALHWLVLPRALAGIFAVFTLVALSALVSLLLAYLNIYGLSPWALDAYLHLVGRVFSPEVTLIFAFKTFFFALTVALVPLASSLYDPVDPGQRASTELQLLMRLFMALLLIQLVSLLGNYA